jgi:DNA-binding transcriptional MerR regulator
LLCGRKRPLWRDYEPRTLPNWQQLAVALGRSRLPSCVVLPEDALDDVFEELPPILRSSTGQGQWHAQRRRLPAEESSFEFARWLLTLTLREGGECEDADETRARGCKENAMAYTVKQVAAMSGVSVRTLHYYDEAKLLKPAYYGTNGYRFYEEPQLLKLQQILFYRELGFELKRIKRILGSRNFEIVAALKSHRKRLEKELARTRTLIETVDKTIQHLKGRKKMQSQEMFAGFHVAAGEGRFGEHVKLGASPTIASFRERTPTGRCVCLNSPD